MVFKKQQKSYQEMLIVEIVHFFIQNQIMSTIVSECIM